MVRTLDCNCRAVKAAAGKTVSGPGSIPAAPTSRDSLLTALGAGNKYLEAQGLRSWEPRFYGENSAVSVEDYDDSDASKSTASAEVLASWLRLTPMRSNNPSIITLPTLAAAKANLGNRKSRSLTAARARDVEPREHDCMLPITSFFQPIHTQPTNIISYSTGADPGEEPEPPRAVSTSGSNPSGNGTEGEISSRPLSPGNTTIVENATTTSESDKNAELRSMDQTISPETHPPEARTREELQRQRPDGIFIDRAKRIFVLLEFTRPYDNTKKALLDTDERKREKYEQLLRKLQEVLPQWTGAIATFTLGVKGTVLEPQWKKALRSLNIPDPHHPRIISEAIKGALEGLDTMLLARSAQLKLGQGAANVPRQPLFPNPQSRQPSLG